MSKSLNKRTPFFLYYSILHELQVNQLKVNQLKGFKFCSVTEGVLWQTVFNNISSRASNGFYGILEEAKFILSDAENGDAKNDLKKLHTSVMIRCCVIGYVAETTNLVMTFNNIKEIDSIVFEFLDFCVNSYLSFNKEFDFEDYDIFIASLYSFANIYSKSKFLNNIVENGEKGYSLLKKLENESCFSAYFSPFNFAKTSLVGIINKGSFDEVPEMLIFDDHVLYFSSTGESSFFPYVFTLDALSPSILLLENFKLLLKVEEENQTQILSKKVFKETFVQFVFSDSDKNDDELKSLVFQSHRAEQLERIFWMEQNKRQIKTLEYKIEEKIKEHFRDFKQMLQKEKQEDSYRILFLNIHNSIKNLLVSDGGIKSFSFSQDDTKLLSGQISKTIKRILLEENN